MSRPGMTKAKFVGRLLRAAVFCFVFGICILLGFRMCEADHVPNEVTGIVPTDALKAAYKTHEADGHDPLQIIYQSYPNMTSNEDAYGWFTVPSVLFIPEIGECQVVIRYNISTVTKNATAIGYEGTVNPHADWFDFSLVLQKFDDVETRIAPDKTETVSKGRYEFRRFVFKGVNLDDKDLNAVFLDFYQLDAPDSEHLPDYSNYPLSSLCIFDLSDGAPAVKTYRMTSRDKKILT